MSTDRVKGAWSSIQNLQDPMGAYARMYRAKVVAQTGDADEVGVRPDDTSLPDMARVPLRHGIPGAHVQVALGSYVLVGWDDGRPDKAFAALWNSDAHAIKVSFAADVLNLGGQSAGHPVPQGDLQKAAIEGFADAVSRYALAIGPTADPPPPGSPVGVNTAALVAAVTALKAGAYLSENVRTT